VDAKVHLNNGEHLPTKWSHDLSTAPAYPAAGAACHTPM
jgi:hypothetical protein